MAQSSLPANIQAHIQGDISGQVAVGNNIIQIGSVHGGVVNILAPEEQPLPRPRPSPVFLRPRPFPDLLNREKEISAAVSAIQSELPVEFCGQGGIGKTTLLRDMAYQPSTGVFSDGIVYLSARNRPVSDVLQSLLDVFYESDVPLKSTDAQIRHALQGKQALILLDDVELPGDEVQTLMDAAPGCAFVLASTERCLWGEGRPIALRGLPVDDALALVERQLDPPLTPKERDAAKDLCTALEGHPLRILQAVALAQEEGSSLAEVAEQMQAPDAAEALTAQSLASLSESEQRVLAALAAVTGAPLDADHLAALARLTDAAPVLERLQGRGLVQAHSPRYSLAGALGEDLEQRWDLGPSREQALTHFANWAEEHRSEPDRLADEAEPILELLRWGVDAGRWEEVLRLGRAVEGALALNGQWAGWAQVLQWGLHAARTLADQAAEGWALHQVGTRALCLGETDAARTSLTQALQLREALGDRIGAEITRHNLDVLGGPPLPPERPPEPPPEPSPGGLSTSIIAAVSIVSALVLALGGLVIWRLWPQAPPPVEARVDIWLAEGCRQWYEPGFQTQVLCRANMDGWVTVQLDGQEVFPAREVIGDETYDENWQVVEEPGQHSLVAMLDLADSVVYDECSFFVSTPTPTSTRTPMPTFTPTPTSTRVTPTATFTPTPTPTPPPPCVDFEDLELGTTYSIGSTFTDSGIKITVEPFQWSSGEWSYEGVAVVGNEGRAGGLGQEMAIRSVNLGFDFGGSRDGFSLLLSESRGNLNIEINGDFRNFENFADINGLTIGGVNVSIISFIPAPGYYAGTLELAGTINSFAVGGQWLWMDGECPVEEGDQPTSTPIPTPTSTPEMTGPIITAVGQAEDICGVGNCAGKPTSTGISAMISDESGIQSVELRCAGDSGLGPMYDFAERSCGFFTFTGPGPTWTIIYSSGMVPPDFSHGVITYWIEATDNSPRHNKSRWGPESFDVYIGVG